MGQSNAKKAQIANTADAHAGRSPRAVVRSRFSHQCMLTVLPRGAMHTDALALRDLPGVHEGQGAYVEQRNPKLARFAAGKGVCHQGLCSFFDARAFSVPAQYHPAVRGRVTGVSASHPAGAAS